MAPKVCYVQIYRSTQEISTHIAVDFAYINRPEINKADELYSLQNSDTRDVAMNILNTKPGGSLYFKLIFNFTVS